MKAEKEHIDELIVSYLSNELDGNAVHELKEWIAASVENEKSVSYTHLTLPTTERV